MEVGNTLRGRVARKSPCEGVTLGMRLNDEPKELAMGRSERETSQQEQMTNAKPWE